MLPYPGRYESHDSWMRRCDSYDADQRRQQQASQSNWGGYNYLPVLNNVPNYKLQDGRVVFAVKICRGSGQAERARAFAAKNGLCFVKETLGRGITSRVDGVAFLPTPEMLADFEARLNDDTPRIAKMENAR